MVELDDIVILILSTTEQRYEKFKLAVRSTWVKDFNHHGIKCFFYEGNADINTIDGDTIKVAVPDGMYNVSKKLVETLKIIYSNFPDTRLVYRTNLSSYIDIENFLNFVKLNQLDQNAYCGTISHAYLWREKFYRYKLLYYLFNLIHCGNKIYFASGSGFFLGNKHCKRIIHSNFNAGLVDDIMVAHAIKVLPSLSVTPLRLMVSSESENSINEKEFDHLIQDKHLFHYRFKTKDRDRDAVLLRQFGDKSFRRLFFTGMNKV